MSNLKFALSGLIAFLCLSSVLKFLIPHGNMKKLTEVLISLTVAASFVFSISFGEIKTLSKPEFFKNESVSLYSQSDLYSRIFGEKIETELNNKSLNYKSVTVNAEKDSEGYIVINEIIITVEKGDSDKYGEYLSAVNSLINNASEVTRLVEE